MTEQFLLPEESDFRPSAARLVESLRDTVLPQMRLTLK